eukprot:6793976-Heterocapsa_arctica.AAC.1
MGSSCVAQIAGRCRREGPAAGYLPGRVPRDTTMYYYYYYYYSYYYYCLTRSAVMLFSLEP